MAKERKLAILRDTQEDFVRVYSPYNKNFVEHLKINIPPADREPVFHEAQDGKKRFGCWRVRRIYLNEIYKLMVDFFGDDIESDLAEDEDMLFDRLFELIPHDKLDRAYRLLSQIFHPDAGGDSEQFKKLKTAYEMRKNPESYWE